MSLRGDGGRLLVLMNGGERGKLSCTDGSRSACIRAEQLGAVYIGSGWKVSGMSVSRSLFYVDGAVQSSCTQN